MRKLIFLLLLLLIATPCFGQDMARMSLGVIGSGDPSSCGRIDSCTGYLICQNFETCTDGTGDCDALGNGLTVVLDNSETWTATLGTNGTVSTIDTTSPIGRQCKQLKIYAGDSGQSSSITSPTFTAQDVLYTHVKFRILTTVAIGTIQTIKLDAVAKQWIQLQATGALKVVQGAVSATTVGTLSANTTYHIWMRFTKGTGANSVGSVAFSTDTTEPTSGNNFASFSTGAAITQVNTIVSTCSSQMTLYYDNLLVDDAPIVPLAP